MPERPHQPPASPVTRRRLLFGSQAELDRRAGDVLVLIFLRGGMDGLHVVNPYADADYHRNRPGLAVAEPDGPGDRRSVDLDGFFGLHPNAAPLKQHFDAGRLAIVHACGSPDDSRSHFEAMQTMERGVADGNTIASGWLARHLNGFQTGNTSPMRAIAIGDVLPKSLVGALQATAVRTFGEFRLREAAWTESFRATLATLCAGSHDSVATVGRETLTLLQTLDRLDPATYQPANGAFYGERGQNSLADGLREAAQLIKEGVGLEVATLELGGWDAHAGQVTVPFFDDLITKLATALDAFAVDLGDDLRRVTVVAMSEFGRRLHENTALGTDHGRGTAMFVMGGNVRGGQVFAEWPGLAADQLEPPGDLRVTTDYRDILAEIVGKRLGNSALDGVFPRYRPRFRGVVA